MRRLRLRSQVADEHMEQLRGLDRLEHVVLHHAAGVTDRGLAELTHGRGIRTLRMEAANGLTDRAFGVLAGLPGLERVSLAAAPRGESQNLTGDGLAALSLPAAKELRLARFTGIGGLGLRPDGFPRLRRLTLAITSASAAARVASLPSLRELAAHGAAVTAEVLDPLTSATKLDALEISVAVAALPALARVLDALALRELEVGAESIDDELLRACARARGLRRLVISGGSRGERLDVASLRALESLEELSLAGPVVPESWRALADHPRLRVIRYDPGGSPGAFDRLRKEASPSVHVLGWRPRARHRRF